MKKPLSSLLLLLWALVLCQPAAAQEFPEVPGSVPFAGINVKLDAGARRIVESDVRSLMANRRYWEDKLDKAVLYFPIIEGVLIEEEVPIDFKYLAVQESSLAPDAVSTSNAVGFWQLKQETAQEFGIRVDNEIDERKSISASTHAAARYLKRSNKQYNNWVSSLFSYYLGMGGISQLVPPEWSYAREVTLTARTDRYILRFIAHKIAFEAAFDRHRTANTIVLLEASTGKGQNFDNIAADLGVNALDLRRYNRWVNGDQVPADKDYMLAIPVTSEQINKVREKLALGRADVEIEYAREDTGFPVLRKASVQLKGRNDPVFYEINGLPGIQARSGDQAAVLAKAAKISVTSFLRFNDMTAADPVVGNEVYYLASKNKKAMIPFHTVREGETLRGISQMYGIRLKNLMTYNRITNRTLRLQTGRVMWLMKKRPARQPVEVVERSEPAKVPARETRPAPAAPISEVPQTPADRKVYSPKLAEATPAAKSTPTGGAPTGSTPTGSVASPPASPAASTPTASAPASVYQPSAAKAAPKTTPAGTNDRVVIISEEDNRPYNSRSSNEGFVTGTDVWTSDEITTRPRPAAGKATEPRTTAARPAETRPAEVTPTDPKPAARAAKPLTTERTAAEPRTAAVIHTVRPGQTYFSVSKEYSISVDELLAWNKLTAKDRLAVGQRLRTSPPTGTFAATAAPSAPASAGPARVAAGGNDYQTHTVKAGENLFRISQTYNTSMDEIKKLNGMAENTVRVGQKLKVPRP
jgi:membrane-bound lytic murein transglycosylase D